MHEKIEQGGCQCNRTIGIRTWSAYVIVLLTEVSNSSVQDTQILTVEIYVDNHSKKNTFMDINHILFYAMY